MQEISDFFYQILSVSGFPPRWYCGKWSAFHGWLYIVSDLAIWGAYFAIPILLLYFINKRRDVPFLPIFGFFIAFILSCGATHLIDAIIFWYPIYHISAVVRAITAIISWATVFALYVAIPKAFQLKSPEQLRSIIHQKTQELTLAYEKLAQNELLFRTLVNNNPDTITLMDVNMRHIFVNQTVVNASGLSPDFFIGKTHAELGYPEDKIQETTLKFKEAIDTRKNVKYETYSWDVDENDENAKYFHLDIVPLVKDEQPIEQLIIVAREVTEQKNLEKKLKNKVDELQKISVQLSKQNQQLQDFAHITSHNLRSPVGNLEALYTICINEKDRNKKTFWIDKIGEVIHILKNTIDSLTEVVKIREEINKERQVLSFEEQLESLKTSLYSQILATQAEITADFTECPTIEYPKIYLESIMLNLLTNALKYRSPERTPKIHFETKLFRGQMVMTCKDNGLGIDLKKHGHKIFGLYKTFHRKEDARGVGLFITKNQIEALGGEISVSSEPDQGTTFRIIFNKLN